MKWPPTVLPGRRNGAFILSDFASDSISLERQNQSEAGRAVCVDFPGFTHLGLWTYPDSPQPYICIEPWFGIDSTAGVKAGMQTLKSGKTFRSVFSITVRTGVVPPAGNHDTPV